MESDRDTDVPPAVAPSRRQRAAIATTIALVAGIIAYLLHSRAGFFPDYVFAWRAAGEWLAGSDPYAALPGGLPAPFESPLLYPFPTVLAAVPLARLPLTVASAITMAIGAGLLAWALTARGWGPLWMLASAPFVMAVNVGQWSPLVVTGALLPSLGFLAVLKPNLGLATLAYRPDWRAVAGAGLVVALSIALLPGWPAAWLRSVQGLPGHPIPLLSARGAGLILLLALLRWRTAEARLLITLACVPQLLFFADQLPLMLVARTDRDRKILVLCSLLAFVAWFARAMATPATPYVPAAEPFVLLGCYAPALALVLRGRSRRSPGGPAA